jgi:sensor domain CHASE-containing protein
MTTMDKIVEQRKNCISQESKLLFDINQQLILINKQFETQTIILVELVKAITASNTKSTRSSKK